MYVALDDSSLIAAYAHAGPFVTLYLDVTGSASGGMDEIDQRWASVADRLAAAGADPDSVEAIEECLTGQSADLSPHGLVAVAAEGELCLSRRTPSPPESSVGFASPLPHLLPYLARTLPEVPNLVVLADPETPSVFRAVGTELQLLWRSPSLGLTEVEPLMTRAVARLASHFNPELVVVVGHRESAVNTLKLVNNVVVDGVTVRYADADEADPAAVHRHVEAVLREHVEPSRVQELASIRSRVAARDRNDAVTGLREVVAALRMSQVDTVVLAACPEMLGRCWIGARPTEFGLSDSDARSVGVRTLQHDRIGSALVRAIVATGARLLIAHQHEVKYPQGIAAVLR